jgi:hypothetical protein
MGCYGKVPIMRQQSELAYDQVPRRLEFEKAHPEVRITYLGPRLAGGDP